MTGELSPLHWLVVGVVFMVLFGAKRMPDVARGLGRSLRILKAELGTDGSATPAPPVPAPASTPTYTAPTYTAPTVVGGPTVTPAPAPAAQPHPPA